MLAVVEAVAHHEFIGGGDADIICLHIHCAALGFVQQGAELSTGGVAPRKELKQRLGSVTRIHNVFYQQHMPASYVCVEVFEDAHIAGGG